MIKHDLYLFSYSAVSKFVFLYSAVSKLVFPCFLVSSKFSFVVSPPRAPGDGEMDISCSRPYQATGQSCRRRIPCIQGEGRGLRVSNNAFKDHKI